MRNVDPDELDRPRLTALVNGLVAPRPIAWVSTTSTGGTHNLAPFSFFNAFATKPFTIGIGPGSREGVNKDSLRNIKETGELTVNVVTEGLATVANLSSAEFDASVDEWEITGLTERPSTAVGPPVGRRVPGGVRVPRVPIVDLGPVDKPTNSLVIARVVRLHVSEGVIDLGDPACRRPGARARRAHGRRPLLHDPRPLLAPAPEPGRGPSRRAHPARAGPTISSVRRP